VWCTDLQHCGQNDVEYDLNLCVVYVWCTALQHCRQNAVEVGGELGQAQKGHPPRAPAKNGAQGVCSVHACVTVGTVCVCVCVCAYVCMRIWFMLRLVRLASVAVCLSHPK